MPTMPIQPSRQRQHRSRFQPAFAGAVERTKPAKVAFQVRRRDALEPSEPSFEPAEIRVGVLDVPGAAHALTGAEVHRLVLHMEFSGRCSHGRRAVCAQHGVALDARLERLAQTSLGHRLQQKVSRWPTPRPTGRAQPVPESSPCRALCATPARHVCAIYGPCAGLCWNARRRFHRLSPQPATPVSSNALTGCAHCKKR